MKYTLGIDIGTYESKGVLVDFSGNIVAQAAKPHKMIVPQAGWAEHRADEDWWGDFVHITHEILAGGVDSNDISAIACSGIGPCMLPVNTAGEPLMNAVLYGVDTRAELEIQQLTDQIGADNIMERCGNVLTSQSVGPKILWLRNNRPDIFAKTAKILNSTSYLVHCLTGEYVIDHYTASGYSPLYDADELRWSDELTDNIIELEKLPRLLWSNEIAGHISQKSAAETGLAIGTPVTAGTIDAAAEALSVGTTKPGDMMMMYGSTIFIIALTDARVTDPRLWYAPWLFKGEHASMAGLATSGTVTHWFRDQFARELDPEDAFPALAKEAERSAAGANGLVFLPYFSGERTPIHDTQAKGVFFGLNLTHNRGDMFRALIEGIAYGTRHVTDTFAELGQGPKRLLAVGGGTKNKIWLQATSDITGIDQIVCEKTQGASYGDAFLAALAIGAVGMDDLSKWNPAAEIVKARPDPSYTRNYGVFRELYEATKHLMQRLS
jgi:xylulokinase